MPAFPDLTASLCGTVAELRLAAERDIPEILIAHQEDARMYADLGLSRPPSGAELGRRIDAGPIDRAAGTSVWLTIVPAGSDELAGQVDVHEVDWDHRRAEMGIWVAPPHRGRGLATDALRVAGRWLLDTCGLERVAVLTERDNVPMRRAAVAAGFTDEGRLRAYLREGRRRVDVAVLSLIAQDLAPA